VGTAPKLPLATSVTISGSGSTPTFIWTFPESFTPDGVRVQIWDLENQVSPHSYDLIHVVVLPGDATTYTLPSVTSSGKTLEQNHLYSLEITFALTHDGVPLGDNTTILTRSRSFLNFELMPEGSPPNVFLPIVVSGPVVPTYYFGATVGTAVQTIYLDPVVAIGYEYATGPGDPNFASVTLPAGIGDNLYNLYVLMGNRYVFRARIQGGVPFYFARGGVKRFLVLGVEEEAALDPNNPTAFLTGLTFTRSGTFTGTMTPITGSTEARILGGGWMASPAGAYRDNPSLEGHVLFGFAVNYMQCMPLPEGPVELFYDAGRFRFQGNMNQVMKVDDTGTKALVQGTGTLNGTRGYSFAIWVGDISTGWGVDTLRIRIWKTTTGDIVYDNDGNQQITGGSILVHKK
jgi:hypothetical protein